MKIAGCISTIIFGMRASLIAGCEIDHLSMTNNVAYFLDTASVYFPELAGVLHVSSVAVMNHTQPQHMLNEDAPLPPLSSYQSPYDVMKRTTEEIIAEACQKNNLKSVQLRISGIFSNEIGHNCIQMSAIRLQAYVGCYIRTPLDMNTGLNVCHAIRLLLERMEESPSSPMSRRSNDDETDGPRRIRPIYYYTRPTIEPKHKAGPDSIRLVKHPTDGVIDFSRGRQYGTISSSESLLLSSEASRRGGRCKFFL